MYLKLICFLLFLITEFCTALQEEGEAGNESMIIHDGNSVVVMKGVKEGAEQRRMMQQWFLCCLQVLNKQKRKWQAVEVATLSVCLSFKCLTVLVVMTGSQ